MTDLTPEERTVLRRRIDFRRQMGHERVSVMLPELTALLDAADEADRLQDELACPMPTTPSPDGSTAPP